MPSKSVVSGAKPGWTSGEEQSFESPPFLVSIDTNTHSWSQRNHKSENWDAFPFNYAVMRQFPLCAVAVLYFHSWSFLILDDLNLAIYICFCCWNQRLVQRATAQAYITLANQLVQQVSTVSSEQFPVWLKLFSGCSFTAAHTSSLMLIRFLLLNT